MNSKFRIKNHAVGTISKGNATGYTTATCEIGFEIGTLFQKKIYSEMVDTSSKIEFTDLGLRDRISGEWDSV